MKTQKTNKNLLTVKIGSSAEFFDKAKKVMRALDKNEKITPSRTLIFTDPSDMLNFLSLVAPALKLEAYI